MAGPASAPLATHVVFQGARRIAQGSRDDVLSVLERHTGAGASGGLLVFELATGKQVELDRASNDILPLPVTHEPKGPGRPRLGVLSREVSLLPRHWEWLETQSPGLSGTLRRLVEHAMRNPSQAERQKQAQAAVSRFLFAMAGDRPNYEAACRALFAGDAATFGTLIRAWPKAIRDVALSMAKDAFS